MSRYFSRCVCMPAFFLMLVLCSCHESLEQRAAREAREFTDKYCPTPERSNTRIDSTVFDIPSRTYAYYGTLLNVIDDTSLISANRDKFHNALLTYIQETPALKRYKEARFNFSVIFRSEKEPSRILYNDTFTPDDYN